MGLGNLFSLFKKIVLLVKLGRFRWSKAQALAGKFSMILIFQNFNNHDFGLQWQIV